jgi:hypothetical protein
MVLAIIVSAVVFFMLVLGLLAGAAVSEYAQLRRIRFDPQARPFTLTLQKNFDPEHALLWATQVPALQMLSAAGHRGLKYECLYRTFQKAARRYPELYDGSSFAQWLLFLERQALITMSWSRVRLTEHGMEFLQHCVAELQSV